MEYSGNPDQQYPCCLVGSEFEGAWIDMCQAQPISIMEDWQYQSWIADYGEGGVGPGGGVGCAYTWTEI
jgi:hypothetical protein